MPDVSGLFLPPRGSRGPLCPTPAHPAALQCIANHRLSTFTLLTFLAHPDQRPRWTACFTAVGAVRNPSHGIVREIVCQPHSNRHSSGGEDVPRSGDGVITRTKKFTTRIQQVHGATHDVVVSVDNASFERLDSEESTACSAIDARIISG